MYIYNTKNKMEKVLIITYYWPPSAGAGVHRWLKFSKYLSEYGYRPIIYTPNNFDFSLKDKTLELPNIEVIRKPIFDPGNYFQNFFNLKLSQGLLEENKGFFEKVSTWIRGNIFIPDSKIFWVNPSFKYLKKFLDKNKIRLVITTGPPHSMHLIGLKLKKILNIKWIADFRDPMSNWDVINDFKPLKHSIKKITSIEKSILKNSDIILVTNDNLAKEFSEEVDEDKIKVIDNGTDFSFMSNGKYDKSFKISYLGSLHKFRDPQIFFEILKELINSNGGIRKNLKLYIAGPITKSILNRLSGDNILSRYLTYKSYISNEETFKHYVESSLLLLLSNKDSITQTPSKIYDYASSGRRVLTLGKKNKPLDFLLKDLSLDKRIDYDDKDSIKKIILKSYDDFKKNKKPIKRKNLFKYERKFLTKTLSEILSQI